MPSLILKCVTQPSMSTAFLSPFPPPYCWIHYVLWYRVLSNLKTCTLFCNWICFSIKILPEYWIRNILWWLTSDIELEYRFSNLKTSNLPFAKGKFAPHSHSSPKISCGWPRYPKRTSLHTSVEGQGYISSTVYMQWPMQLKCQFQWDLYVPSEV